ncbi:MAG: anaerobic glycerol-3-phosphate dehydrogenase subunit C [Planctomycetaceae bacterium]|nr:anaerobic glycerol-3-phosphate dehydrogenase subunit C [Planctomycetaceae bacterium]MCB9953756.1 anaerobic glycerol-3-phosphate dehydrogenase subunit C [Planctomycetaceae bacterium]
MDDLQQQVLEDLSGEFEGDLRFDEVTRQTYSTDASLYQIRPLGIACPRHKDDVKLLAKYSAERYVPLVPRGAGTGLAGGAIGKGLIVDFSRYMRDIEEIGTDTVRVQPGVVREHLNRRLREIGRYFAPDPSNNGITTIGGMIGVDAAGSHAARVGSTRDHVKSLGVVISGGVSLDLGRYSLQPHSLASSEKGSPERTTYELAQQLAQLVTSNRKLIEERQPPLLRNCAGYFLRNLVQRDELNWPSLLVGSEGTLAMVTEATLHTMPLPAHRGCVLLLFGKLESAIQAVRDISELQPSACDLLDRRLISLAREAEVRFEKLIPASTEAALLVEQTGYGLKQVQERLRNCILAAKSIDSSMVASGETYDPKAIDFLWTLPYRVVPLLTRLQGETRPLPIVEDIAVPPDVLNDFLVRAQRVFQKHWVTASLYAHAASGQVHFRPFLKWPTQASALQIESLARELYEVVFAFGGTISGEHGDGLSRTSFLRSQYGPLYRVFRQVKDLFDPHNLMNPGKIISDDPHLTISNFRPNPEQPIAELPLVDLQMQWKEQTAQEAVSRCNGCGVCRVQSVHQRMCPFFHLDPRESASPRAKANLLRGVFSGEIQPRELTLEQSRELADSCFNCRQCVLECPSHVDIPAFVQELRASYVAANGLNRGDWTLSRAHSFGRLGTFFAPLANWALNNGPVRWLLKRILGIAPERRLPRFANRTFLSMAKKTLSSRERSGVSEKSVAFFVDHYVNFHDPELGWALVAILQHNGFDVYVPPDQTATGMAMLTAGDLESAKELAEQNIRVFGELAREGMTILCTEPTAAVCLTQDYPKLLEHPDLEALSNSVVEAGSFLTKLHKQGKLKKDFSPLDLTVGYHTPCHLKALEVGTPLADLLTLIPGLKLERIEKGCSGMAGAFGLADTQFETSLKIGEPLMAEMRRPDLQLGTTECSGCKLQMEQQTTIPTIHPLKLLALSYGYMPEIRRNFSPNTTRRTVRS